MTLKWFMNTWICFHFWFCHWIIKAAVCWTLYFSFFNPLKAELNPICHLLALLGAHPIFHVSRIRVNNSRFKVLSGVRIRLIPTKCHTHIHYKDQIIYAATPPNAPRQCILTHFNYCNFSKTHVVCSLRMV
jgi:hypothetical protein